MLPESGARLTLAVTDARNEKDAKGLAVQQPPDLAPLFHRLNNQLGIILANAELLEAKLAEGPQRARAAQIAASALDAMTTARELRSRTDAPGDRR